MGIREQMEAKQLAKDKQLVAQAAKKWAKDAKQAAKDGAKGK